MGDPRTANEWWLRNARSVEAAAGIAIAIVMLVVFVAIIVGSRPLEFPYMASSFWILLPFLFTSIFATVVAFVVGLPLGFLVGWARTSGREPWERFRVRLRMPVDRTTRSERIRFRLWVAGALIWAGARHAVRRSADGYVEIMRGTPLFVQILFVWSLLLLVSPRLPNLGLYAGIIAMTLNTGGYQGEIFRAGLQTVHSGQVEAARSIGLTRWGAMRNVVLPQAVRLVTPPLLNEFIGLFKGSALLYFIAVEELTFKYKELASFETRVFELFAIVTLLYLMFTVTLSKLVSYLERRYRVPGLGIHATREPRPRRTRAPV